MLSNILIAEDDIFISEHLKLIIINMGYNVCEIVSSYHQAVNYLEHNEKPDLALLDIRMHGEDQGVEIAKYCHDLDIPFIYITSFSDKKTVQQAVEQEPKGYIIKPFSEDEIIKIVAKTLLELETKYLSLKEGYQYHKILFEDILYLKSDNVYVEIHTLDKKHLQRIKLMTIECELPNEGFIRIHRSYIINAKHIQKTSSSTVTINGKELPLSKNFKEDIDKYMGL